MYEAMGKTLAQMGQAQDANAMHQVASQFERIAQAENEQWLPAYYSSYVYAISSFMTTDDKPKDERADKAQEMLEIAKALNPDNSEIYALQGFVYLSKLVVAPMMRGMTYGGRVEAAAMKAVELDPNNPRGYYVHGMYVSGMPKFMGGGPKAACPLLTTALEKFETFEPSGQMEPNWGEDGAKELAVDCATEN